MDFIGKRPYALSLSNRNSIFCRQVSQRFSNNYVCSFREVDYHVMTGLVGCGSNVGPFNINIHKGDMLIVCIRFYIAENIGVGMLRLCL